MMQEYLQAWDWQGTPSAPVPYGEGHINQTYVVQVEGDAGPRRCILQRINTDTFRNPDQLMENVCGVTEYLHGMILRNGGDPARETLHVRPTREGKPYYRAADGGCWRVYDFIEDTVCLQSVRNAEDFCESAAAFGNFQRLLADYPVQKLHETIPHFHDTPKRLADFEAAVQKDPLGRAAEVADEIAFVLARREDCRYMTDLLAAGKLPLRVTHNDTKLNNVLLDKTTGKGICVIDLDTVMPGLVANDFGDSIRFGANDCAEDEPDTSKVHFSLPLYEAYTRSFLGVVGDALTPLERETLPWGARLMTLECGMRFLADYLEGDHYFHIHRPAQNLDRARTQFKLVADMENCWADMQRAVR